MDIVLLNETWLDASVEAVDLPGYIPVGRLDRAPHENRDGVIAFVRYDFGHFVELEKSQIGERIWFLLHVEIGNSLIGNWYRPGNSDISHIQSLRIKFE